MQLQDQRPGVMNDLCRIILTHNPAHRRLAEVDLLVFVGSMNHSDQHQDQVVSDRALYHRAAHLGQSRSVFSRSVRSVI